MDASDRLARAERLLDDSGRAVGPIRMAADQGGVVLGFPRDPMLHVSWPALAVVAGVIVAIRLRRA